MQRFKSDGETLRVVSGEQRSPAHGLCRWGAGVSLMAFVIGAPVAGADGAASGIESKRGYHLFRAVPRELMRELSTDRPDLTESPYTVDAGHFQIEADAVSFSREAESELRHDRLGLATANAKIGLMNRVDLQLVVPFYQHTTSSGPAGEISESGIGNSMLRLKVNLWGNDGGSSALALMPFVGLSTATHEGASSSFGMSVPLALELPAGFGSGFMYQIGVEDELTTHSATATVGHPLFGPLSGYAEVVSTTLGEDQARPFISVFSTGVTWAVNGDVQLDGGLVKPTTSQESGDFTGFLGLAVRR